MAFEFLSSLDTTAVFLLLIIFILFVISMKKIMSIIMGAIWIAVASVLFPIAMNRLLGWDIPMDPDSLISFIMLGLGAYFVYLLGKSIYKILGIAGKAANRAAKKVPVPEIKRDKDGNKDDREDDKASSDRDFKKREKELAKREKELAEHEKQVRFTSAVRNKQVKAKTYDEEEYAVLKDRAPEKPARHDEEKEAPRKNHITPLPVIEHKKKRKKHEDN